MKRLLPFAVLLLGGGHQCPGVLELLLAGGQLFLERRFDLFLRLILLGGFDAKF